MTSITATIAFALFAIIYALGIWTASWQENELSLSHEKAIRMNIIIIVASCILFAIAIWAFTNISWDDILIKR